MRKIIIDRINKIKADEDNFKSEWWEINFVSYSSVFIMETKHISEVDFDSLNDDDLVRIFEYVIRCHVDIVTNRVNKQYFNRK